MHARRVIGIALFSVILALPQLAASQDVAALESQVTTFTLDNGLKFIIAERHDAPVFSYVAIAKVGGVNEVPGITGLAHMFEHMAFKGTDVIGTKDIKKERKAIEVVDEAYHAMAAAKRDGASDAELEGLKKALEEAQKQADEFIETNEFGGIIEKTGGSGLNASTSADFTTYYYNLPSNKLELWAYLESERFERPVLREYYKERDVVMEERRMRTESSPIGRLIEEFLAAAYLGHPYGQPVVGHQSDLESITREDAVEFYEKYYTPRNVTVALVGDVDPKEVRKLAEKYFGDWKGGPQPDPVRTIEPAQRGERRVALRDPGQPFFAIGYHKPAANHPDDPAWDVMSELFANGRSSRLHQRMVKDEKIAVAVGAFPGFPGVLYPGLMIAFAVPSKGVTAAECEAVFLEEIERLKNEPIPMDEFEGTKTRIKANWVRGMRSNSGYARNLLLNEIIMGDWREALQYPQMIDAVSVDDVKRIAQETLTETNRTIGVILTEEADDAL